jgi:hypothetical protein
MARLLDTHSMKPGDWNPAPTFARLQTVADRGLRGYTLALAARCVR